MLDAPLLTLQRWLTEARTSGENEPEAMALGTIDSLGRPAVRYVLARGIDERSLRFFTHYDSEKGKHLADRPVAAATFFWAKAYRQARVVGRIETLSAEDSDHYWASRPRGHQLSGAVSPQSHPIPDLAWLQGAKDELENRLAGAPVPRPPRWGGFRLVADEVELWQGGVDRFHDRMRWTRRDDLWTPERLAP